MDWDDADTNMGHVAGSEALAESVALLRQRTQHG